MKLEDLIPDRLNHSDSTGCGAFRPEVRPAGRASGRITADRPRVHQRNGSSQWLPAKNGNVRALIEQLTAVAHGAAAPSTPTPPVVSPATPASPSRSLAGSLGESGVYAREEVALRPSKQPTMVLESYDVIVQLPPQPQTAASSADERVVRVTAQNLSRLMSLAGESLVEARWLQPFAKSLQLLKQNQDRLAAVVEEMHLSAEAKHGRGERLLHEARQRIGECRELLSDRIGVFEEHARQSDDLSSRLYYEVIASRLRPFADGIQGFPEWSAISLESSARRSSLKFTATTPTSIGTSSKSSKRR